MGVVRETSNNNIHGYGDVISAMGLSSGYFYLAGWHNVGGDTDHPQWRIEKRDAWSGNLVAAFGSGGVIQFDRSPYEDRAMSIAVSSAVFYVGGFGRIQGASNARWRIENRDTTTGALIASFGGGGVKTNDFSTGDDYVNALAMDATGLYVGGNDHAPRSDQWRVERLGSPVVQTLPATLVATTNLIRA